MAREKENDSRLHNHITRINQSDFVQQGEIRWVLYELYELTYKASYLINVKLQKA